MKPTNLALPLRGVIVPMVTPLLDRDTLDAAGLERLVEHLLGGGAHGLFVLGSTGEAPSLSHRLRMELVERACRQVANRVPVLVGITDTSFVEAVELACVAGEAGASAVVAAAPYYFPTSQPELLGYIGRLVAELPLPLFLYNIPSLTKVAFEPETVRLAADIPGVVGLKDSSGNMAYFHRLLRLLREREEFSLLIGSEELMAEAVLLGAHGGVPGGANLYPQLFVGLYETAAAGRLGEVAAFHRKVMDFGARIYGAGSCESSYLAGLKCALSLTGICSDLLAEPYESLPAQDRSKIRAGLADLGLRVTPDEDFASERFH